MEKYLNSRDVHIQKDKEDEHVTDDYKHTNGIDVEYAQDWSMPEIPETDANNEANREYLQNVEIIKNSQHRYKTYNEQIVLNDKKKREYRRPSSDLDELLSGDFPLNLDDL
jgi:hypothetical protein